MFVASLDLVLKQQSMSSMTRMDLLGMAVSSVCSPLFPPRGRCQGRRAVEVEAEVVGYGGDQAGLAGYVSPIRDTGTAIRVRQYGDM